MSSFWRSYKKSSRINLCPLECLLRGMWPVIKTHTLERDGRTWNPQQIMVDQEPNECPYCYKTINPLFIKSYIISPNGVPGISLPGLPGNTLQSIYRCPNQDCGLIFIASYAEQNADDGKYNYYLSSVGPRRPRPSHGLETIKGVSSKFYDIYDQAQFAEEMDLKEICGMGYRKALEFLIRDYIKLSADEDKTKKQSLGTCINNYIDDPKIKEAARRATWLGNDETHYYRKWDDMDLQDLKTLLRIAINFVDSDLMLKKYTEEMT
jgi:hypothetical protein